MKTKLERAVAGLYQTFSTYQMPEHVDMSDLRDPETETGAMRQKPLRELGVKDLDAYAYHALSTVGDEALLKYLLPRLLELVHTDQLMADVEIVVSKLDCGGWQHWPEPEQQAIRRFLMAWWTDLLNQSTFRMDRSYGVLASTALAEDDLSPYLDCWDTHSAPSAADQLADLFAYMRDVEKRAIIHNPFLEQRQPQAEQIRGWLFRPETLRRLEGPQGAALRRGLDREQLEHYKLTTEILRALLPEGAA